MNTFYFDEQVRALEKQFAREYEDYLQSNMNDSSVRALQFLMREICSNGSTWSGGNTLKNYEEQVKREIAIDMARMIVNQLAGQEERNEQV